LHVTTFIKEFYDDEDITGQDTRRPLRATKALRVFEKHECKCKQTRRKNSRKARLI